MPSSPCDNNKVPIAGDVRPDRRDDAVEFFLLRTSRAFAEAGAGSRVETMELVLVAPSVALLILRVLKLDEDRCLREGMGWLAPKSVWFALMSVRSAIPVDVDEVDVVDEVAEADCCRSRDSFRVSRLI